MATGDKLVNLEVLKETVQKEVVDLKSALPRSINLLPITAKTLTQSGVTSEYSDGHIVITGPCTQNGGRLAQRIGPFTLSAGIYTFIRTGYGTCDIYVEKTSDDLILLSGTAIGKNTFTLTEETELYIGFGFAKDVTYDVAIDLQINKWDIVLPYYKPSQIAEFPSNYVTPEQFGAKGDGVTDDTIAIQEAVDSGLPVLFSPRTYVVTVNADYGAGISITNDNTVIYFNGATIQLAANAYAAYEVIYVNGANGVTLIGSATVKGDRETHTGTSGEHGHVIDIGNNANKVIIDGITASYGWGDGIYVNAAENVIITNCQVMENRRNNVSIIRTTNCLVKDCYLYHPNGTAPESNFGVEANTTDDLIKNLVVDGCICEATTGFRGMYVTTRASGNSVTIRNCKLDKPFFTTVLSGDDNVFSIQNCEIHSVNGYGTINCDNIPANSYITYDNVKFFGGDKLLRHDNGNLYHLYVKNSEIVNATYSRIANWTGTTNTISDNVIDVTLSNVIFSAYAESVYRLSANSRLITNSGTPFVIPSQTTAIPFLLYSDCVFDPQSDGEDAVYFRDVAGITPGQKYRILNISQSNAFTVRSTPLIYDVTAKTSSGTPSVPAGHYIDLWNINNKFYCEIV